MSTVPKPKRTVTIQMGPHIAVLDSFGNKEPNASWEGDPSPKLISTPASPKEHRRDNVCLDATASPANNISGKPSGADTSASACSGNGGEEDSEDLIGRGLEQTGALIGQCAGDRRESPGASSKATSEGDAPPPLSPKASRQACDGPSAAPGSGETPTDPTAQISHASRGFQTCGASSAVAEAPRETPAPEQEASDTRRPKGDKSDAAGIHANAHVPLPGKPEGSGHSALSAQTATLEVHRENYEHRGSEEEEVSFPKQGEGLPGGGKTSATPRGTEPCSHPQASSPLRWDSAAPAEQRGGAGGAGITQEGPQSAGSLLQEAQLTRSTPCKCFQEAGTMTTPPERRAYPGATWRDAEVQAVTTVCSRSAATSPCHFPPATPPQLCRAAAGAGDGPPPAAGQVHAGTREGASPKEGEVFGDAGVQAAASSQTPPSSGHARLPESGGAEGGACKNAGAASRSGSAGHHDMELGARPKEPGLHVGHAQKGPLQPVYQIHISACSHAEYPCSSSSGGGGGPAQELSTAERRCAPQSDPRHGNHRANPRGGPATPSDARQTVADVLSLPDRSTSTPVPPACSAPPESRLHANTHPPPGVEDHQGEPLASEKNSKQREVEDKSKSGVDQSGKPVPGQSEAILREREGECRGTKGKTQAVPAAQDEGSKLGGTQAAPDAEDDGGKQADSAAVPDVVWDEQGMTWEVYGASVDPESLGFAIQSHLLCKIKEHEKQIQTQTSRLRKSLSTDSPRDRAAQKRPRGAFRSLLHNVGRPKCCARTPPSVLE